MRLSSVSGVPPRLIASASCVWTRPCSRPTATSRTSTAAAIASCATSTEPSARCVRAITEGKGTATDGSDIPVRCDSICIHSDTPNAIDIARAVRFLLESPAITGTTLLVDGGQHLSAQARDVMFLTKD